MRFGRDRDNGGNIRRKKSVYLGKQFISQEESYSFKRHTYTTQN